MSFWNDARRKARLARILFEVAMPTAPSNAVKRIRLCREGLQLTKNPGFQSLLQYKLGLAHADNPEGDSAENTELALDAMQSALQFCEQAPPLPSHRANILLNLGTIYHQRRRGGKRANVEKALAAYEEALTILTYEGAPDEWATLKANLGRTYMDRVSGQRAENIEQAIFSYNEALMVRNRKAQPKKWAALQNDLGEAYLERLKGNRESNIEQAMALFRAAIEVSEQEKDRLQWAMAQQNLGGTYVERFSGKRSENIEAALQAFDLALTGYASEHVFDHWVETQINRATALSRRIQGERKENLEQALQICLETLAVCSHDSFPEQWATINYELGHIYLHRTEGERSENLELGITASKNALTIYTSEDFLIDWTMTQTGLAQLYEKRAYGTKAENLEIALQICSDTLTALSPHVSPMHWANTKQALGLIYSNRITGERAENVERGITAIQEALVIFTEHNLLEMWATANNLLGAAYQNRLRGERSENIELAIEAYQHSLSHFTHEALPEEWARTQHNLGTAYVDRVQGDKAENLEMAIQAFQNALLVRSSVSMPFQWVMTQDALGTAYRNRVHGNKADNYELALEAHKAALAGCSREAAPELWPVIQHNLGVAYDVREKGERSNNIKSAIDAYEASIEAYMQRGSTSNVRDTSIMLATLLLENNRHQEAYNVLQRATKYAESLYTVALTEEGKRAEVEMNSRFYRHMVEACLSFDPPLLREAFLYAEEGRSRLLRDQLSMLSLPVPSSLPLSLVERENNLLTQLRDLENASRIAPDEMTRQQWVDQALDCRQQLYSLWDEMTSSYHVHEYIALRRGEKVTWKQIQIWLQQQEKRVALVAFYTLIEQVIAFIVREGDNEPTVVRLNISQEELFAYVERCWREVYEFDEEDPLRETWFSLGKYEEETPLLDQIIPHLLGTETLYLIPHGLLNFLPLHALQYENKPFITYFPIAYLPSVATALRIQQQQSSLSVLRREDVLVLGNPTSDLEEAQEEAEIIAHHLGVEPLPPVIATKEYTQRAFQHKQLIHVATHAVFSEIDPFASGILLAPNLQDRTVNAKKVLNNKEYDVTILTAYEILATRLQASLVVLSACETGRLSISAGDEQDGLARALLYAGVPSLLLSKWSVNSEQTRTFMLNFYTHLYDADGKQQVSLVEALHATMVAGFEAWNYTYYWAPFILFGDWK